jgi:hypothetical protein
MRCVEAEPARRSSHAESAGAKCWRPADPSDFMKEECGFESFGALKRAEQREFNGEFRTRDRILKAWNRVVARSQSPTPIVAASPAPTA